MPSSVSPEVSQLYDWMLTQAVEIYNGKEGQHTLSYIYQGDEKFSATYLPYLVALKQAGWIKLHQHKDYYVLGYGAVKFVPFGSVQTNAEKISAMWERYQGRDREIVELAFKSFAGKRKRESLTELQQHQQLEFYSRYSLQQVISGLRTYLSLPPTQQYGEQYAQGIIRNNQSVESPPPVQTSTRQHLKPSSEFEQKKRKEEWVRTQIDPDLYGQMNYEQQQAYLDDLRGKYEQQRTDM